MKQDPGASGDEKLLERELPLAAIGGCLAAARDGHGSLVIVGGEAGVGKTALCRAAMQAARALGMSVATGACDALAAPQPLGPFREVSASLTSAEVRAVFAGGPVLPSYEVMDAFTEAFRPSNGVLVVLEDVHWADGASLDLMRRIARRVAGTRATVLVTYRNDEVDSGHPLQAFLGDVAGVDSLLRLVLDPLTPAGVALLAEGSDRDPADLYARTGGNPFFVTELLAAGGEELPEQVRDVVLARTARLSGDARKVLEAAAVVPVRVELDLLLRLCPDAEDAVDECQRRGMLVTDGNALRFRHELARAAVESAIPAARRTGLHRAVMAWLREQQQDRLLARMVHHAMAAGDVEAVGELAPRAGDQAADMGSHREAAHHYGAAVAAGEGHLPDAEIADLLYRQALELHAGDDSAGSLPLFERALDLWRRAGDTPRAGLTLVRIGNALRRVGRGTEALEAIDRAVAMLEAEEPGPELAIALRTRCGYGMMQTDKQACLHYGERAIALFEELGDGRSAADCLINVRSFLFVIGEDPGGRLMTEAIEGVRSRGMTTHVAVGLMNLASSQVAQRDYANARATLEESIAYSYQHGCDAWVGFSMADRARLYLDTGEYSRAAEEAASVLRQYRTQDPRMNSLLVLGLVRARRGDPGAWEALDEAWSIAVGMNEVQGLAPVSIARLEAALLTGDRLDEAAQAAAGSLALAEQKGLPWPCGELHTWLARAGRGRPVTTDVAEPWRLELHGDAAGAREAWRGIGAPYEAAMASVWAEEVEPGAMRQAVEELHAIGARQAAVVAARRLRSLGVERVPRGARRTSAGNPFGLTRRELEVLALLLENATTAEAARRLFVSPRTVEHHVEAIYAKLGVNSRSAALELARDRGLSSPSYGV